MRKIFRAEYPDMLGVPKEDIVVSGLQDLRNMLRPTFVLWNVYIEQERRNDPVWGDFHYVVANLEDFRPHNSPIIIGIVNFYE